LHLSRGGRGEALEVLDGLAATKVGNGEGHADATGKEGEDAGHLLVSGKSATRVNAPRLNGGLAASGRLHASDIGSGEDADGLLLLIITGDLAHHAITFVAYAHTLSRAPNALGPLKVKGRDAAAHAEHRHKVTHIHTGLFHRFVSHFDKGVALIDN